MSASRRHEDAMDEGEGKLMQTNSEFGLQEYEEPRLDWRSFEGQLLMLCKAKAEEFALLGYDTVKPEELWACVQSRVKGAVALHDIVSRILTLKVSDFMNYETMNAYKGVLTPAHSGRLFDDKNRS